MLKHIITLIAVFILCVPLQAEQKNSWCGYCRDMNYNILHKYDIKNWQKEVSSDCKGGWLWPAYIPC